MLDGWLESTLPQRTRADEVTVASMPLRGGRLHTRKPARLCALHTTGQPTGNEFEQTPVLVNYMSTFFVYAFGVRIEPPSPTELGGMHTSSTPPMAVFVFA